MYNDNTPAALGYRVMHLPSLSLLLPVDVADFVDDKAVGDAVAFVEASRKKEKEADSSDKNKVQFKDGKEAE